MFFVTQWIYVVEIKKQQPIIGLLLQDSNIQKQIET